MLDAWCSSIAMLQAPPLPAIDWPAERRWLVLDGMPPRPPLPRAAKVLKMPPRRPRADVDDAAVLRAIQAAGAAKAPALARALAINVTTIWRRLESLERAGAAWRSVDHIWRAV